MRPPRPALLTLAPLVLLALLSLLGPASASDFTSTCPSVCDCKWVSGNKAADCCNKGLSTIPDRLSSEIQNLDLSGNPLYELTQAAFERVGLSNLKKVNLRNCSIQSVHRNAFANLRILIEVDLTKNEIKTLHSETFHPTEKLRVVHLSYNYLEKIEDGLFKNLKYLQKIVLSHNHIHVLGDRAFTNSPTIKTIELDNNNLTHAKVESINLLTNLTSLILHNNPWKCDCKLQPFRDWIIDHNLYTSPTDCYEPPHLHNVYWSSTESGDFACRPTIIEPLQNYKLQAVGENITMACKAIGNPLPSITWVQNTRIINGDSKPSGDQRFHITESDHEKVRWTNLTISHVRYHDKGEYNCVAKNPAGEEERTIFLSVSRTPGAAAPGVDTSDLTMWIVIIIVTLIFLAIIVILCCYFCRRRDTKRHMKSDMHSSNGEALIEGSVIPEMEKSLITTVNPVTKPPRIYEAPSSVMSGATEMSELNKTLLDNDSVFAPNEDENRTYDFADSLPKRSREALLGDQHRSSPNPHSGREARAYPPDLLSFPPRAAQASPASSSASTAPDTSRLPSQSQVHSPIHSPIYGTNPNLFRTLPYSRSQSPFTSPVCPPAVTPRQGYVTIPRRPRVPSWSSAASTVTPVVVPGEYVEPVYDNLGLRTTADGSSVLSLNKAGLEQQFSPMRGRPLPATPGSYHGPLPVMYAPIEEQERAPSPAPSAPYSSTLPRMNGNSLHLQLSPNTAEPQEPVNRRLRGTPETGVFKRFTMSDGDRQSPATPLSNGRIYDTASANNDTLGRSGKVPPRPPPKPKKRTPTEAEGPLFEDEGEDGTEV